MRYRVEHVERNSISRSNRVLFCLLYKHNMPLLRRKDCLIYECKNRIHNPIYIFSKYYCLIYSTFLSRPPLAYDGKEKAVPSGWRIPVLAISTGFFIPLVIDSDIMVQEHIGKYNLIYQEDNDSLIRDVCLIL